LAVTAVIFKAIVFDSFGVPIFPEILEDVGIFAKEWNVLETEQDS